MHQQKATTGSVRLSASIRLGGKALNCTCRSVGERDKKTVIEAAVYCPGQINALSYTRGFTPPQWVLSRSAADTYRPTSAVFNPSLSPMNDPLDFNQIQAKRLADFGSTVGIPQGRLRCSSSQSNAAKFQENNSTYCSWTDVLLLEDSTFWNFAEEQVAWSNKMCCKGEGR